MSLNPQNLLTISPSRIQFYLKKPHFQNPSFFTQFKPPHYLQTLKSQTPYSLSHAHFTPIRAFQSDGVDNVEENRGHIGNYLEFDAFLYVAEFMCLVSSGVVSFGLILNTQKPIFGWLGNNRVSVWQFVLLVGGLVIGAVIRRRQWRRICVDYSKPGRSGVNLVDRIEKLEEDLRSSATIIRVMSRQLEKLGIRFRVTRKALKEPIAETAALAQKNSEATRALAVEADILEKELREIQNVLLAMQEQQQKQLELILAIAKNGKLWDSKRGPTQDQEKVDTRNSATAGVNKISPNEIQALARQKDISNDKA